MDRRQPPPADAHAVFRSSAPLICSASSGRRWPTTTLVAGQAFADVATIVIL